MYCLQERHNASPSRKQSGSCIEDNSKLLGLRQIKSQWSMLKKSIIIMKLCIRPKESMTHQTKKTKWGQSFRLAQSVQNVRILKKTEGDDVIPHWPKYQLFSLKSFWMVAGSYFVTQKDHFLNGWWWRFVFPKIFAHYCWGPKWDWLPFLQ